MVADRSLTAEEASKALFGGQQVTADDASLPTVTIPAGDVTDEFTIADAFVAAGLAKGKARARAPAIVLQLLAVMTAVVITGAGMVWLAIPLALLGVLVASLLLTPAAGGALTS